MWRQRGAVPDASALRYADGMRSHLADALPRVRSMMHSLDFEYVTVCGGVIGPSGLYLEAARDAGVRAATFDGGLGWVEVNTEGVAAQQTDMPRTFALLDESLERRPVEVEDAARHEYELRRTGRDNTQYQLARPGTSDGSAGVAARSVLIPLSVIFDASALGRHHIFEDSEDWLVTTIGALLEQTDDRIIVRQHPSERKSTERSRFDVRAVLDGAFGDNGQLWFVAAEDDVSTYDLLDATRLVLPFVSTIGIEAAALGKPTIISGAVYYAGLGFVYAPETRNEYLDLLARGARDELPLLPDQTSRAWRAYYLNAVCHRVWTNFGPQPPDFWRWVSRLPDELYGDPAVDDILTSIDRNVPLPILRHERLQQAHGTGARPPDAVRH
jgi:hypothetical protein